MDWNLAVEKNHAALKRILAMLVAMVGMTGGRDNRPSATLPRHLHRFVLSLLRPAESATRRLIIVAARGLAVKLPKPRALKGGSSSKGGQGTANGRPSTPDPHDMPEWALHRLKPGLSIELPRGEPIPLRAQERPVRNQPSRKETPPRIPFFPMFDPMKRFDRKPARRRIPDSQMPRIVLLNDDGWSVPIHLRRTPPPRLKPTPDDPLDATRILGRLEMMGRALDDLPRQDNRFARWKARRDARSALAEKGADAQPGPIAPSTKTRRFTRMELMRPGRPPGWRKKPIHEVHEVLNVLHGLAVWVRDGP